MRALFGFKAKGRKLIGGDEGCQFREAASHYKALSGAEKRDIAPENTCFWQDKLCILTE
jgi:hypothetical protein